MPYDVMAKVTKLRLRMVGSNEEIAKVCITMFNNGRCTTNIPTDPHTVPTTDIKTNMRHIHTSIVS